MILRLVVQFAVVSAGLYAQPTLAQQPGAGGIIYGPRHAFMVTAPPGWVLDTQAGKADGLVVVFYRTGESWQNGDAVMYVNTVVPDSGRQANPSQVMRDDSVRFSRDVPGIGVARLAPMRTKDGRVANVRRFTGDPRGSFEMVAYVAEKSVTPILVLSARSRTGFEAAQPAFRQLVSSYSFVTADVRLPPN